MMRNIYTELKKLFTAPGVYICIAATVVLLFSAQVYTDHATQDRYSAISAAISFDREYCLREISLCSIAVMQSARGGWLTLFVPIITAFCFVPSICSQRDANAVRFQIFRSSKLKFSLSQYFSGIFSAGFATAAGYAVFCTAAAILFPSPSEYGEFEAQMIMGSGFSFPLALLGMWLYGIFWSIPAMFCTSFLRNKYLIMCIPFFVKYGITQLFQRLTQEAFADYENINYDLLNFTDTVRPEALIYVDTDQNRWWILLVFGAISVLFLTGYLIIQRAWGDSGA